jgi:hypothetical protein
MRELLVCTVASVFVLFFGVDDYRSRQANAHLERVLDERLRSISEDIKDLADDMTDVWVTVNNPSPCGKMDGGGR